MKPSCTLLTALLLATFSAVDADDYSVSNACRGQSYRR